MSSLLGKKIGMTQVFDNEGNVIPVTVISAGPCVVTQLKTEAKDGYNAIQVGFGKAKKINKPKQGHLKELNARHLREFRVDKPEEYKVGQEIKLEILKPGDTVSVTGTSIGKGFAGTVKRHHHSRGLMTHGSKSHRLQGSIGAGTTPGRVWPGTRMSGRMGFRRITAQSLVVVKVDAGNNVLLLAGTVPGKQGNLIIINKTAEAKEKPASAKASAGKAKK
ncbi:MAG: 50S ribosomal protein L3 [Candidatus Margulisiibacteriota bacterium]